MKIPWLWAVADQAARVFKFKTFSDTSIIAGFCILLGLFLSPRVYTES